MLENIYNHLVDIYSIMLCRFKSVFCNLPYPWVIFIQSIKRYPMDVIDHFSYHDSCDDCLSSSTDYQCLDMSQCNIFKENRYFSDQSIDMNKRVCVGVILVTPDNKIVVVKNRVYGI